MSGAWQTVRVFISSTFRDMHAERDHLVKVVFPALRQWCEARRLHLVDIDLRWGVTEDQANDGRAIDICLGEIDGSRPFFVCILGGRYGWVPDSLTAEERYGFRGLQDLTHRSITHLEILHAADQPIPTVGGRRGRACEHACFYLRRDGCVPVSASLPQLADAQRRRHDDTYFERDRPQDLVLLKEWIRSTFAQGGRVHSYGGEWDPWAENPEDDAVRPTDRLVGRLTELDEFGQQVCADLTRAIANRFAAHIRAAGEPSDPLAEERALHRAFVENRTQVFVPRARVDDELAAHLNGDGREPLVLSGPPGSGKSAILAHLVKRSDGPASWLDDRDRTLLVPRFIGASPSSTSVAQLLAGVCRELVRHYGLQEEVEDEGAGGAKTVRPLSVPQDPALLQATWPTVLEKVSAAGGRLFLVLDALNQLDRSADPLRSYWLPRELPRGVRLIVSVLDHGERSLPETLDRAPQGSAAAEPPDWLAVLRRRGVREVAVPELDSAEQREVIRRLPSVFCKTLGEQQVRAFAENEAARNPLFLTVALEELRVFGGFATLNDRVAALPRLGAPLGPRAAAPAIDDALDELFGQLLDRLDREATARGVPRLVPALARLLASAKEGLSERELEGLLSRALPDVDPTRRQRETQVVLRQVRRYLMRKGPLLDFYHRSFWKAVRAKYLASASERHAAHQCVAEYFADEATHPYWLPGGPAEDGPALRGPPNERKLVELPWQRLQVVREARDGGLRQELIAACDRVEELFRAVFFLEAKAQAGRAFELADEFTQCVAALPADRPRRRVLRLLEEALRRDVHFIGGHADEYPQALFQCLWNSAWWYDAPEAEGHYRSEIKTPPPAPTPGADGVETLHGLLEGWRAAKEVATPGFPWVRCLRPPAVRLGTAMRAVLRGHEDIVWGVSFSPDGRRVASGSADKTVRVWDTASGAELHVMRGHEHFVDTVAFSPDGSRLASSSRDKTIRVWDPESGAEVRVLRGHDAGVGSIAFSPDGRWIASAAGDLTIRVWDADSGAEVRVVRGHKEYQASVSFSPDGRRVVTGSRDKAVCVWDVQGAALVQALHGHDDYPTSVAFSPDGGRIVSASADGTVRTWDAATGDELRVLRGHDLPVNSASFSPDGRRIASGSEDDTLRVWDADSGAQVRVLRGHEDVVNCVAFAPDGRQIASASLDFTVRLWDAEGGEELRLLRGHDDRVGVMAFSADGRHVASGSDDRTVRIWDALSGAEACVLRGHEEDVRCLAFSRAGGRIVTGSWDKTARLWDLRTGAEVHVLRHPDAVLGASYSPDGRRIATASGDKAARVWDAASGQELLVLRGHAKPVHTVSFSRDSRQLASSSGDNTVRVWDCASGAEVARVQVVESSVRSLAFSEDGRRITIALSNRTVQVWELPGQEDSNVPRVGTGDQADQRAAVAREGCAVGFRALIDSQQTRIDSISTGAPVAWFPDWVARHVTHPDLPLWAGQVTDHVCLIRLEGRLE